MTKGGRVYPGHNWVTPAQSAAAGARRRAAEAAAEEGDERPRSRWDDPTWQPGPAPEVVAAGSVLAVLRAAGEW